MFANQKGLTRDKLVSHLRVVLTKAGINPDLYASHWRCHGVAHEGIEDSMIMTLGRWKAMLNHQSYVRIPQEHLAQLSLPHGYSSQSPSIPPSSRRLAFSVIIMFVCIGIKGISVS